MLFRSGKGGQCGDRAVTGKGDRRKAERANFRGFGGKEGYNIFHKAFETVICNKQPYSQARFIIIFSLAKNKKLCKCHGNVIFGHYTESIKNTVPAKKRDGFVIFTVKEGT